MSTQGGDVAFRFLGDTSGLTTAVKEVAQAQEAAAAVAAKTANEAKVALESERLATVKVTDAEKELAKQLAATDAAARSKAAALGVSVSQLKQVEAATQKAAAATAAAGAGADASSAGFEKMSGTIGKATQVSGALGGVIGRVDPQIGAAVTSVGSLAGAFQGLASAGILSLSALGPIAVVVLAGAAAYAVLAHNLAEAEAAQKKMSDAADAASLVHEGLDEVVQAAAEHYRVASGQITAADLATEKQVAKTREAFRAQEKEIDKLGLAYDEVVKRKSALWVREDEAIRQLNTEAIPTVKAHTAAVNTNAAAVKAAADAAKTASEFQKGAQAATDAAASRGSALVAKIKADQKKADDDLTKAEVENAAFRATAEGNWAKALEAAHKEQEKVGNTAMSTAASVASSIADAIHMTADAAASAYTKAKSTASKIAGQIKDLGLDAKDAAKLTGDALVKAYTRGEVAASDLSDAQKEAIATQLSAQEAAADKRAKIERKAAMEAFEAQQGAAVASALVAGAVAIVQAFAQLGPIAGAIAAVGIGVTTGVEVAAIEAQKPSFHAGGMYPDEGSARVLGGEPIINRQAAARMGLDSPGAVDSVNHGGGSLGGVTVVKIGRLEAREIVRTDVSAGGLIVQAAQRAARSSGNAAGRTGRRPVA